MSRDLARSQRWKKSARRPSERAVAPERIEADPAMRAYEQGPISRLQVPAFPATLVAIYERQTGRQFDPDLMQAYERARAFVGYTVDLSIPEQLEQLVDDPHPKRQGVTVEPTRPVRTVRPPVLDDPPDFDAHDLGD